MNLSKISNRELINRTHPKVFHLIILPTEKCNFRCVYCYEDFKIGRMKDDVVEGTKNLLTKRAEDMRGLRLDWFGGEPLLAKDIVLDVSRHAKTLSVENRFVYSGSITTNGYYLTAGLLSALVDCGVTTYQISIDGDKESHDTTRILANGKGTYDTILENLVAASRTELHFRILIRFHVTAQNSESAKEAVRALQELFAHDSRFQIMVKGIEYLGGSSAIETLVPAHQAVDDVQASLPQGTPSEGGLEICYAAAPNSLMIRADGRIGKCTAALNSEKNSIGSISRDGTMKLDNAKLSQWTAGFTSFSEDELVCPAAAFNLWF